jgi:DNA-binding HxlR family transcriptional regulator/DNA-binding NarL/FixJ family response regulator
VTNDDTDAETVVEAVDLISKKWHPVIIQTLLEEGPQRFNELKGRLGISAKVLTDSLDDLAENDLVERRVLSESPKRVEYDLTRHGRDMQSVISALADWGDRHLGEDTRPVVLIVDNDPRLVRMHASWLEDDYRIKRAYDGEEAMRKLDEEVDIVLLDRRMPGLQGEDVLRKIRGLGIDCRAVVLSAVEPDFDVLEMGFDAYVVKPGTKAALREVVEDVLARNAYDDATQEYLSLSAKRALLRAEKNDEALRRDERYRQLESRLNDLADELDDEPAATDSARTMLNANEG